MVRGTPDTSRNPYAPPTARVADIAPMVAMPAEPPFFAVSIAKLVIMCVCTLTVYEVYWFYRNWKRIAAREGITISAPARAIFSPFFCYSCFARIRDYDPAPHDADALSSLSSTRVETSPAGRRRLPAARLAFGLILVTLLGVLPTAYGALSFFSFVFLIPVQSYVNQLNAAAAPSHHRNARIRGWDWVLVIPGAFAVFLVLLGLMIPNTR